MSLEAVQLRMNNIADRLDRLSSMYWQASLDFRIEEYSQVNEAASKICEQIAKVIREEMQITHY